MVTLILALLVSVPVMQQPELATTLLIDSSNRDQGIRPLTTEGLSMARLLGESPNAVAFLADFCDLATVRVVARYRAGVSDGSSAALRKKFRSDAGFDAPYRISVNSPYARVVLAAMEAKRRFQPTPALDVDQLNNDKVTVVVTPGKSFPPEDVITDVVIHREGQTVRPLKRDIKSTVVQNRMGASAPIAESMFVFDFPTFKPTAPITLVLIGKNANYEWDVTVDELALLK
jgi:hypothetical protein